MLEAVSLFIANMGNTVQCEDQDGDQEDSVSVLDHSKRTYNKAFRRPFVFLQKN